MVVDRSMPKIDVSIGSQIDDSIKEVDVIFDRIEGNFLANKFRIGRMMNMGCSGLIHEANDITKIENTPLVIKV